MSDLKCRRWCASSTLHLKGARGGRGRHPHIQGGGVGNCGPQRPKARYPFADRRSALDAATLLEPGDQSTQRAQDSKSSRTRKRSGALQGLSGGLSQNCSSAQRCERASASIRQQQHHALAASSQPSRDAKIILDLDRSIERHSPTLERHTCTGSTHRSRCTV